MGRRRTRRRGGRRWTRLAVVALVALAVLAGVGLPTATFTAADLDRGSNVDVVTDDDGALGLNTSASVATGRSETLFVLTNRLGANASVTVSLDSGSASKGDLVVDGVDEGDEATFDLAKGGDQPVEFAVPCDDSLVGDTVTYTVNASAGAVSGVATRSADIAEGGCVRSVVHVDKNDENITTIERDGADEVVHITEKPAEIGPARANLDSDSALEVTYIDINDNHLEIIGFGEDSPVTLDSSGSVDSQPVGVGDYDEDGKDEVYYNRDGNLYAIRDGENLTPVASASQFDIQLRAVAGVADFDGDGEPEVVFSNNNNEVGYVDDNGTVVTTGYQNLGSVHSIGRPADFDGDGEIRVPVVTSSGYAALVDANGQGTVLNATYGQVGKDSLAAHDIDGDGSLEVVFADTRERLHYMELDGTHAVVTNANGTVVSANPNKGAA